MIYLLLFAFSVLFFFFPWVRCLTLHPIKTIKNAIVDSFHYFRYKQWRLCREGGKLLAFTGLFGRGKTLSAVHYLTHTYKKYNDKKVWCRNRKKWVTQKIMLLSNVHLNGVPYTYFTSLNQFVSLYKVVDDADIENDTLTVVLALCDEASCQLNSREYKSNCNYLFLQSLLQCRHFGGGMSFIYTAQRFCDVDALLRRVTGYVINCDKKWRFQQLAKYDANELENATNLLLVKPISRSCWFVTNFDYSAYDTKYCVEQMTKSFEEGDLLSNEEILNSIQFNPNNDNIATPSYKLRKQRKGA